MSLICEASEQRAGCQVEKKPEKYARESAGPGRKDLYVNKDSTGFIRRGEFGVTNHQNRNVSLDTIGLLLRDKKCYPLKNKKHTLK